VIYERGLLGGMGSLFDISHGRPLAYITFRISHGERYERGM